VQLIRDIPELESVRQMAVIQAFAIKTNNTDCRLLGHRVNHNTAMTAQQMITRTQITRETRLCGPTGVHSVRNGAAPSSATTVAIIRPVNFLTFRYPRQPDSQR
jgi:hypothetical protein